LKGFIFKILKSNDEISFFNGVVRIEKLWLRGRGGVGGRLGEIIVETIM